MPSADDFAGGWLRCTASGWQRCADARVVDVAPAPPGDRAEAVPPPRLWVVCPQKPGAEGGFALVGGRSCHRMPVWAAETGQRLFSDEAGRWVVGTEESIATSSGWMVTEAPHGALMPSADDF
eukprot:gene9649-9959_t